MLKEKDLETVVKETTGLTDQDLVAQIVAAVK